MSGRRGPLPASAIPLLAGALLMLAACQSQQAAPTGALSPVAGPPADPADAAPGAEGSPEEGGLAVTREGATARLALGTHLFVEMDVDVLTRRGGIVRAVVRERGDRVKKGAVLCELESEGLRLALELAEVEADRSRSALRRAMKLHEVRAISDEEREDAEFNLRSAERARDLAAHELEKSYVRAPFSGFISSRSAEVGQVLAEDDPTPLFRVTALEPLLARLFVPQWAYTHLHKGDKASVESVAASALSVEGRVRFINDVLDAASGSAEIFVEVPGVWDGGMRPGMEVLVEIRLELPEGRLTVPREAVRLSGVGPGEGEVQVRVAGSAQPRRVRLGFLGDDRIEILSGLADGDLLSPAAAVPRSPRPR